MSHQSISDLLGEDLNEEVAPLRYDRSIVHVPLAQLGDGLAGPVNDQPLVIFRDERPLAVDELGMGHLGKLARHRAGRAFPLNDSFDQGIDHTNPGRPARQDVLRPSPLYPGQNPEEHVAAMPPEVIRGPGTVFFTASPYVGWGGY